MESNADTDPLNNSSADNSTNTKKSPPPSSSSSCGCRVITMRVDSAKLLIDNEKNEYVSIGQGIVFFVSFDSKATIQSIERAVHKLVRLPLLNVPGGMWGDGMAPQSIVQLCTKSSFVVEEKHQKQEQEQELQNTPPPGVDVLIVPQANLMGRPSSSSSTTNHSLRYNHQANKELARQLYHVFCDRISISVAMAAAASSKQQQQHNNNNKEKEKSNIRSKQMKNAQHPKFMFQTEVEFQGLYSKFDERGVPTHTTDNQPLTKSAIKKVEKLYKARCIKYEKAIVRQSDNQKNPKEEDEKEEKEENVVDKKEEESKSNETIALEYVQQSNGSLVLPRVVCGVFGNRQGFECVTPGPTMHSLDL